jgi:hypothetical protein
VNEVGRIIVLALLFVLVFASGIPVRWKGRPLNVAVSTVHKLISLAAGVLLLVVICKQAQVDPLSAAGWVAIVVTGLCFVATVASGGVLSADRPVQTALLRVHRVGSVLAALGSAATLYLVL